ncbi:MAG: hypothetical protein EXR75_02425 [Myxococcales bacterium]|nr:hypothetical protein [Myxococcales bacterium]
MQPSPRRLVLASSLVVLVASLAARRDAHAASSPTQTPAIPAPGDADDDDDDDDKDDDNDGASDAGKPTLTTTWGAKVQSDLRFRAAKVGAGPWFDRRELPAGVDRNENLFGARFAAEYGKLSARADLDFVLYGAARDVETFTDLTRREVVDPFRIDAHNLYVEMRDLFVRGLDLRVGQQLVEWGAADQFNPTNNLNADDLEDVLLFGDQQGNMMVRFDYWLNEDWSHQLVVVPVFRPALLPRSAALATGAVDRLPMVEESLRWRLHAETAAALDNPLASRNATVVASVRPTLPDLSFENMQLGYRLAGTLFDQDVSLSYYLGRSDFPVAARQDVHQDRTRRCNPEDASDCIDSVLLTDVTLQYPRMHVFGLNVAGEIGTLKALSDKLFNAVGYRLEAALIVPKETRMEVQRGPVVIGPIDVPAGEYDYEGDGTAGGARPIVVTDTPFLKWTAGVDYTFSGTAYANLQWVHGFPDEFGAGDFFSSGVTVAEGGVTTDPTTTALDCAFVLSGEKCAREVLRPRLGDYLVGGLMFHFMQQKLMLRLFTIFALNGVEESTYDQAAGKRIKVSHSMFTEKGFSAVIYPELNYNFGNGLDLGLGVLGQLGKTSTKFGDPAGGGSVVWTRTRFNF